MAPAAFHLRNRTFPGAKPTPGRVLTTTAPSPRLWPLPSAAGVASALEVRIPVSREELHFVVPAKAPRSDNPVRRKRLVGRGMEDLRRIFLSGLDHQIALAHDPDYTYPSHEYVEVGGATVKRITYKRPVPWWFEEGGTLFLRLNFGERTMIIQIGRAHVCNPVTIAH